MEEFSFKLSQKEAELLMNALQSQTSGVIQKMQQQYMEQSMPQPKEDEEQILVEENNNA